MSHVSRTLRSFLAVSCFAGAVIFSASTALADKVHLKDGRVFEGTVMVETDTFVRIKIKIGGLETIQTVEKSEIVKIEKDSATPTPPAAATGGKQADAGNADKAAASKPDPAQSAADKKTERAAAKAKEIDAGANRVAILNFGPPSSWHDEIGDMVGVQVNAAAWRAAVPLLEKDKVNVVVVRINSGGGYTNERSRFQDLFENVYKKKFRTVGWVESAISAAAMSPYVLEEFYFLPNGNLGACTSWSGDLQNTEGLALEQVLHEMEIASDLAGRSPVIMRAMQVQVPLSATIDEKTGQVTWFGDTSGEHLLNRPGEIFTFTASDAIKFKFARAIAANKEELAAAMSLHEVVWAGEEATKFIDQNMRDTDRAEKQWELKHREFLLNFGIASQSTDRADRGKFAGRALAALREMKALLSVNPNFEWITRTGPVWFERNEEAVRRLLREDR